MSDARADRLEYERYYDSLSLRTEHDLKEYFKKYPPETLSDYDWLRLTITGLVCNVKYINKYYDKIDWEMLLTNYALSEELIEKYIGYINWYHLSTFQKLSWDFIKKYKEKLSLDCLIRNEKLKDVPYFSKIHDLYESKKNDPVFRIRWMENQMNSVVFGRKIRKAVAEDPDYIIKTVYSELELEVPKEKPELKEETLKPKRTRLTEKKIMQMTKAQLKEELDKRKVRYLYKDTIDILRDKLKGTLKGGKQDGNL